MSKIGIFMADGCEEIEGLTVVDVVRRAKMEIVMLSITGKKEVTKVKLAEEVVDPDDIEMLEDLIVAATNEAFRQAEEDSSQMMSQLTGGLGGLGGGFPF